ncbi:MAG: hypothetical protein ACKO2L_18905 [Planctomycetaceae bacterium]
MNRPPTCVADHVAEKSLPSLLREISASDHVTDASLYATWLSRPQ